ncbi:MAG TPA: ABC transporter permease [Synergistaceae bacterium]|nr:ABC transporter permease [Synergistaceae bacterium]
MGRMLRAFYGRKIALLGLFVIVLLVLSAVFAPLLVTFDPIEMNPAEKLASPNGKHWMGTDNFGRDIFSRVVYGARTSLVGSAGVVLFSLVLGVLIGVSSGYFKRVEPYLMRLIDVLMAFPSLLMALVLVSILGRGMVNVIIAVGITYLTRTTRIVYGLTLKLREEPYIEAAVSSGVKQRWIILRHILPNMMSPIIVQATFTFAFSLLDMASLDFLGLGIPPSVPSWGNMLSEGRMYLTRAPWLLLFPGACIVLTVLSFNLAGDVLRDQLDPHFRRDIEGV